VNGLSDSERAAPRRAGNVHRLSYELHPSKLEAVGLMSSVRSACDDISRRHGVRVEFRHRLIVACIPSEIALCFYRIVQEALRNVVKHSDAPDASVRLAATRNMLHLHVADRGTGFESNDLARHGVGLVSMRERVLLVGGRITIRSSPAHGTRIAVHVPTAPPASAARGRILSHV
jgi:signal transduction histidine kinase